jgi:phosphatidylglycerol lysyltransferase
MFGIQGATWVVMGDPVGPEDRWGALLWRLRELSDEAQASMVLYEVTERCLPHAIDLGLRISKYGEEALVDLEEFSLAGPTFKSIRHAVRRAETDGATFEVLPRATIDSVMSELRDVSDEWLETKNQREKGFSLGRFDPDYLRQFDIALVRQQGRIVAFANILALPNHRELSVDLMRHREELPYGSMDFLFSSLMLWGREQGFERFSLGIAPLAGMPNHRLAPMFGRMGDRVFRHGSRFYGFTGLRAFKGKFVTRWAPRYLAAPSNLGLIRSIVSLHSLISRPEQHDTADANALAQI